jgi:hypothetical protein
MISAKLLSFPRFSEAVKEMIPLYRQCDIKARKKRKA